MIAALDDPDPRKRGEAITKAVAQEKDEKLPGLVEALLGKLDDEDPFVRYKALDGLGRLAAFREVALDQHAAEKIIRRSADTHEYVRAETAVAIALLPEKHVGSEARGILLRLLEDASPAVRCEAAAALGDVREQKAIERLASRLADPDEGVRFECAFALASLGDDRGVEVLAAALGQARRRLDACEGLRRLGSATAVPALEALTRRFFLGWADRLTAWATLYACGAREPAAQKILERTRARNREERTYALALIGTHRIREGAAVLAEVARAANDPLRETAVQALGELGDAESQSVLRGLIDAPETPPEVRREARAALEKK